MVARYKVHRHEWLLKRNCSLSPRQLLTAYAVLCCASFTVAIVWTWHGAWYVLAYSVLEMTAVALAFVHYARHATDHEHIVLDDGCLLVERIEGGTRREVRLDPRRTRIVPPRQYRDLIGLQTHDTSIDVGRFATHATRRQVAHELRCRLQDTALPQTPFHQA